MATKAQWIEGARPRTLPTAIAPVVAGSAMAAAMGGLALLRALLALLVALFLVIGVNFANDYSDGIRGADGADRVGPLRLVGSGVANPQHVKAAAMGCFGAAGIAGLVLVALCGHWWLLAVGVACVAAAWYYTGGEHPYGYRGWGEIFVFVFFGLVAVTGTTYTQTDRVDAATWLTAVLIGALACAVLVSNNLRDIDGDRESGKRTLATRLGHTGTRVLYLVLVAVALAGVVWVGALTTWWCLLALVMAVPLVAPVKAMLTKATGMALVPALRNTGIAELVCALGLALGVAIGV